MLKIGIFFGGPSREREISFAGGRTVYDNLDKTLFEAVPVFVDSHRNFILLDWQYIYKGTIRDFYPPAESLPDSKNFFQIYLESIKKLTASELNDLINRVGRKISLEELPEIMDFAFLALHGEFGEDGQIQGLLESLRIPYSGSGIRASAIGMDKAYQKKLMSEGGFACPEIISISRMEWLAGAAKDLYEKSVDKIKWPLVIRPANQGSSIGVKIIYEDTGFSGFFDAVNNAFFIKNILISDWNKLNEEEKIQYVREMSDIRDGLGFPLEANERTIYHPEELLEYLNETIEENILLKAHLTEQQVIVEAFIEGKEFSCIVVRQEDGSMLALPPTEIRKGGEVFDYRSKYLPGLSRKITPIDLPHDKIRAIQKECERLFGFFEFNTYARIDGFIQEDGTIYLNDPNTTSGMLPSSFFFHQAAEIGLNPSQFLTYIIRASLDERQKNALSFNNINQHIKTLDAALKAQKENPGQRKKIAVLLGGFSAERHISVESGRNIYEKLASSDKYEPIPVFLTGNEAEHLLYQIPINVLLKDNADDIRDKIFNYKKHPVLEEIKQAAKPLIEKFASSDVVFEPEQINYTKLANIVDGVFIALHGRPGEDGAVQQELEKVGLPYNGSGYQSSQMTIDKYHTLQTLKENGFTVANQLLISKEDFNSNKEAVLNKIESNIKYPLIGKPVDDGCSSAVKKIKTREQLEVFMETLFRIEFEISEKSKSVLGLMDKEEFPNKTCALLEELISTNGADHFLEITGGLLTHSGESNMISYEIFEPSEALASGEVLSLEEKFLAGEGQNITPARFSIDPEKQKAISEQVRADLEKAARIMQVEGYARIDAFVRIFPGKVETIVIEINSLPGMTPATCIFHQTAINGYTPYAFIDKILEYGFQKRERQNSMV